MSREIGKRKKQVVIIIISCVSFCVFWVDFFIKEYCRVQLAFQSLPIIKDIFHITLVFNTGAAFGVLKGKTQIISYLGVILLAIFLFFIRKDLKDIFNTDGSVPKMQRKLYLFCIALGLILGGALSNFWDRISLGYVVDYIDLRIWPVFNLSDSCITIGTIIIFFVTAQFSKKDS